MMANDKAKAIYVAHPLRPDPAFSLKRRYEVYSQNIGDATRICRKILEEYPNCLILSPIHAFSFVDPLYDKETADLIPEKCCRLLELADELWVYGDYETSEGCQMEIAWAEKHGKPVIYKEEA
jgi:hypothetical protein